MRLRERGAAARIDVCDLVRIPCDFNVDLCCAGPEAMQDRLTPQLVPPDLNPLFPTNPALADHIVASMSLRRNRSFASEDGQVAAFSTMSAAFSPIIIDGALVLPDVSVGMIEASATRRPAMPWTRSWASTTAIGSDPILQVPTGW
jgi:hypothetical protein